MTGLGLVVGNGDREKKKKKIFVSAEPSRHIPSAQGPGTLDTWEQASFLPVWRPQTGNNKSSHLCRDIGQTSFPPAWVSTWTGYHVTILYYTGWATELLALLWHLPVPRFALLVGSTSAPCHRLSNRTPWMTSAITACSCPSIPIHAPHASHVPHAAQGLQGPRVLCPHPSAYLLYASLYLT